MKDYIESLSLNVLSNTRKIIPPYELDIYIPSKNIAIEFNGLYLHSEDAGKDKNYHYNKWKMCHDKGIQLISIWEDQWRDKPVLVKQMLTAKLGVSGQRKVYARKTTVSLIPRTDAYRFLEENHVQGKAAGTYYLGLVHEDELVAVAVFKRTKDQLTLERYATNAQVVGGHSKIISWVQKNLEFDKITTFADLCVSDGSLYRKTGWTEDKMLAPDYRYVVGGRREHKFNFRLKRFRKDPALIWEEGLTERQLAQVNGLPRIWDCGKIRFTMPKEPSDG